MKRWEWLFCLWLGALVLPADADALTAHLNDWYPRYKQALLYTSLNDRSKALPALQATVQEWEALITNYWHQPPAGYTPDAGFQAFLAEVAGRQTIALRQVERGKGIEAHETLEPVRQLLRAVRVRHGIDVQPDRATAFHAVMEEGLLLATRPGPISEASLRSIRDILPRIRAAWDQVARFERPDLQGAVRQRYKQRVQEMTEAIRAFAAALDGPNATAVGPAARQLKAKFRAFYLPFG